jgi:hypothetical protein
MLHEQKVTILEGVLLLLMQKCCNYQALLITIENVCALNTRQASTSFGFWPWLHTRKQTSIKCFRNQRRL